ncbi:MAG: iron-containing redox enzyme family protein [Anaerolineae bacterium]|nr:iron-containing redox enzyme family protein [Anaerolineae bacterium]
MNLKHKLHQHIDTYNLLNSRFYQAWSAGELPRAALQKYTQEYGDFIRMLPQGWQRVNDQPTVEEEQEHIELWQTFAASLDTEIAAASIPEVKALVDQSQTWFAQPATALGALYAFEAQQPATAVSKLEGLRSHYPVSPQAEEYFEVHSNNQHEAEKLLDLIQALPANQQEQAIAACEQMSAALWDALEGIYTSTVEIQ